jgi:tripartite-type tricarboxylate transporter receptor subunit TctC
MITRRTLLAASAAAGLAPRIATAQGNWPSRTIRFVLPYAPGGGTDTVGRVVAAAMQPALGQTVVVENRPGAGGNIATEYVAGQAPDGYTMLMGNQGPMAVNPKMFGARLRVDPAVALEPVALLANTSLIVVAGKGTTATTMEELLAEIRAKGGDMAYASAGNGSASHLATVLLLQQANLRAQHLPFRGAGPALNDVVAGHIPFMVTALPSVVGLIESGLLRALAVTSKNRLSTQPDIRTVAEAGVPGYDSSAWYGVLVPKGTPAAIKDKLAEAIGVALRQPDVITRLKAEGAEPAELRGEAFGRFIHDERVRWEDVLQLSPIAVD